MRKNSNNKLMATISVIVAIFASYCVAFNLFKLASTSSLIMAAYNVSSQQVGTLVSVSGLIGLIFALPAGALVTKFGSRPVGLFAIACSFLGSVVGSFAPTFEILLASRFLEGVSIGAIPSVLPPLIINNIDRKKQSIYMGFFTCFAGVGQIVIFSIANSLINIDEPTSFANVWHFSSIFIGISLALWFFFVRESGNVLQTNKEKLDVKFALKNPLIWIACLITFLSIAGFNGGTNYTMSYCEYMNVDPLIANDLATIRSVMMIASSILVGIIIAPLSNNKRGICLFIFSILILISFTIMWRYADKTQALIAMLIIGFSISAHPTVLVSLTPQISKNPKYTAITNSFLGVGQNLGTISVGAISGRILQTFGFDVLSVVYCSFAIVIVAGTLAITIGIRKNKE